MSRKKESTVYCLQTTFSVICHNTKDLNLIALPVKFIKLFNCACKIYYFTDIAVLFL